MKDNTFDFHTGKCTCGHTNPYIGSHCCEKCGTEAEVDREPEKKSQGRQMFDPGGPLIPPPRALLPKREPEPALEVLEVGSDFEEKTTSIKRPTFEEVYMELATIIARRSTCARRRVGCIITSSDYRRVLSVGYNGNAAGLPNSCDDPNVSGSCGCLHAEENAALSCFESASTSKIVFTTTYPCKMCAKRLIQIGGVKKIYYLEEYRNEDAAAVLMAAEIFVEQIVLEGEG